MSSGPILIVDDEDDLRHLLDLNLRREGFETVLASSGSEALELVARSQPSLIVLDLMLPDVPGTEVCRRVRANPDWATTPIIMLTARGEEIDRVVGFEIGADDYVVKSTFSMREFLLRVRAVLRRAEPTAETEGDDQQLSYGNLRIDLAGFRAFVGEAEVALTATEFKLLQTLAARPGRVQSRGTLLQDVWDMAPDTNTRTVDTHVKRLREKLGSAAFHLETVRGVGYRFSTAAQSK
ncbi:MAG: response regulator transcription factor [Myxococcota bacterium]